MKPLVIITAPHFVAGFVPGERAAPIIRYMLHWSGRKVADYCRARGWTWQRA